MSTPVSVNPYTIPAIVEIITGLTSTGNTITSVTVTSVCCNVYNYTINYIQPSGLANIQIGSLNCIF